MERGVTRVDNCRLIIDSPSPGTWNMAVDEALLAAAADEDVATLRLYQWSEPTLSLGYFQAHDARHQHAASCGAAVVRRQSGGGAILHDRELTYSLSLPAANRFARQAELLDCAVHEAFVAVLAPLIAAGKPGCKLERRGKGSQLSASEEPFLCFQRQACGDLLLVGDRPPAHKVLGSAQRRSRGAILQHGSLLLEQSPATPELPGLCDLTGTMLTAVQLAAILPAQLAAALDLRLDMCQLPDDLRSAVAEIESRKYAAAAWTNRR
jgi:lipoate-protein ligase A